MTEQTIGEELYDKRPFGLYIVIGLQTINALLLALGLLTLQVVNQQIDLLVGNRLYFAYLSWLLVAAWLLASLGLFWLKRWGWTLTMILTGIGLAVNIWQYFQGAPNYQETIIHIVIVFYLNQREVQRPFLLEKLPGGVYE